MTTIASFEMARALASHAMMTALHKFYKVKELQEFYNEGIAYENCWYTIGSSEGELSRLIEVNNHKRCIDKICIDVANGYRQSFLDTIKKVRDNMPTATIMAGNVVTPEMVEKIINAGADICKIGIGSGAFCETRIKTGCGFPQLSAIIECSEIAHNLNAHICSDGGCRNPGDIIKTFAGGADFCMLGSMLAGHKESAAKIIEKNGQKFMECYGMSSEKAMHEHNGGMEKYRTSEGRHVWLPYKGSVENTLLDIEGGLRSACTYIGARYLEDIPNHTIFVRVNETHNKIHEK